MNFKILFPYLWLIACSFLASSCTTINITQTLSQSQTANSNEGRNKDEKEAIFAQRNLPDTGVGMRDTSFRIGLLAGISNGHSAQLISDVFGGKGLEGLSFGINGDLRVSWFGMDLDASYTPSLETKKRESYIEPVPLYCVPEACYGGVESVEHTRTVAETITRYNGMINAKIQLPEGSGPLKIVPKLGVGYGWVFENALHISRDLEEEKWTSSLQVRGPYATLGLEFKLFSLITLSGEYSRSFLARATYSHSNRSGLTLAEPQFSRLRIGAQLKVDSHFSFGCQYLSRSTKAQLFDENSFSEPVDFGTDEKQILGMLLFEF